MAYTDIDKPTDYFNTVLYTGTESSGKTVTGVGFQPDWIWIKNRTDASNHNLYDSVRGGNGTSHYWLKSNSNVVEGTNTSSLLTIDSDGFTLGDGNEVNGSSDNIVSWNWKAGTSVSGTTTGSGTSKAYSGSVNTTSGFSIIKYIGNGTAGHQIPHHLNAVPKMLILKNITGGSENWFVYHASLGNTKDIHLNTTGASATADSWNDTTPTSTVCTMSDQSAINSTDGNDHIAYCFAEKKGFSKFGSYTGNGNADGTFVYTGFKPAMVICKKSSASGTNWGIIDNKRANSFNEISAMLNPNSSGTEGANNNCDFVSNGFKWRSSDGNSNASGDTFIYMAFAESPFVTSSGIPTCAR